MEGFLEFAFEQRQAADEGAGAKVVCGPKELAAVGPASRVHVNRLVEARPLKRSGETRTAEKSAPQPPLL